MPLWRVCHGSSLFSWYDATEIPGRQTTVTSPARPGKLEKVHGLAQPQRGWVTPGKVELLGTLVSPSVQWG